MCVQVKDEADVREEEEDDGLGPGEPHPRAHTPGQTHARTHTPTHARDFSIVCTCEDLHKLIVAHLAPKFKPVGAPAKTFPVTTRSGVLTIPFVNFLLPPPEYELLLPSFQVISRVFMCSVEGLDVVAVYQSICFMCSL